jgi:hypothetical protein
MQGRTPSVPRNPARATFPDPAPQPLAPLADMGGTTGARPRSGRAPAAQRNTERSAQHLLVGCPQPALAWSSRQNHLASGRWPEGRAPGGGTLPHCHLAMLLRCRCKCHNPFALFDLCPDHQVTLRNLATLPRVCGGVTPLSQHVCRAASGFHSPQFLPTPGEGHKSPAPSSLANRLGQKSSTQR